jgi:hypothetical protein
MPIKTSLLDIMNHLLQCESGAAVIIAQKTDTYKSRKRQLCGLRERVKVLGEQAVPGR